eukprot:CAMPEP_0181305502 /NCGR_PEP_ID=MMETSP1101-20121128/9769_1 /TAXON_ID=46948 /ORGANISM="Rhodomonas abbreviata, Strain Caron Lab Isolate" /LENGTH=129 /DNA_ID=CAMNT_0023411433 /DNA_START=85 /DNA_END=474 /DNA_ORIENTATION=-
MDINGLPLYSGSVDHLRHGFQSLQTERSTSHPIHNLQSSRNSNNAFASKLENVRRTYGSHLAMRLATEKETFSRIRRLPGLETSNVSLQTVMGTDESMDFPDFLNDPLSRPEIPRLEVHSQMEIKLCIL